MWPPQRIPRGILVALFLPAAAAPVAAGQHSADYTISADAIGAGGGPANSARYTGSAAIGFIAGIAETSTSPAVVARAGYPAQLTNLTALRIAAPGTSLNEGTSVALATTGVLDDGTTIAVPGASVAWIVLGGPTSVSAAGVVTAADVTQNTSATIQGTYDGVQGAVTLGILDTITTPPQSQTVVVGGSVTFAVVASGTSYQWLFNGTPIPGATGSTYTIFDAQPSDAGSYAVVVTNAAGSVTTSAAVLNLTAPAAPAIVTAPASVVVGVGTGVTLTVAATGTAPLSYQWLKAGAAMADDGRISGSNTATLSIGNVSVADAASYSVSVSNAEGNVTSTDATVAVLDVAATQTVVAHGYVAGGIATITNTVTYSGDPAALGWQVLLPPRWKYLFGGGSEGDPKPAVGDTDLLEWAWTAVPASPVTFTYTVSVPAAQTGDVSLSTLAIYRQQGLDGAASILAQPSPLVVHQVTGHSADENQDFRISLLELTRVIELYNTRCGTVRTGAYAVDPGTEDGFAPDATRAPNTAATLPEFHSADENHDGAISLFELTRVIELYNCRDGTNRTGQYHVQAGTEDGFAPGP